MRNTLFLVEGKAEARLVQWLWGGTPPQPFGMNPRIEQVGGNVGRMLNQLRNRVPSKPKGGKRPASGKKRGIKRKSPVHIPESLDSYSLIVCIFDTDRDPEGNHAKDIRKLARQKNLPLEIITNDPYLEANILKCLFQEETKCSTSENAKNAFREKFGDKAQKIDWDLPEFSSLKGKIKDCVQIKTIPKLRDLLKNEFNRNGAAQKINGQPAPVLAAKTAI